MQLMTFPDTVLRGTFASLSEDLLVNVMEAMTNGDAPSADPECLARCGMMAGGGGSSGGGDDGGGDSGKDEDTDSGSAGGMAKRWGQCGGRGFKGPTACEDGSSCVKDSEYYSQCRPN